MATKKIEKKTAKTEKGPAKKASTSTTKKGTAPVKKSTAPKAPKAEKKPQGPRHPHARVKASSHGSKEALAKALAPSLAMADEDKDQLEARLKTASNAQLLRLQKITEQVKAKYGSRAGLIEAIGKSDKKSKDKDFIAKLESLSLPNLFDIAGRA